MPTLFISYKRGTSAVAPLMDRLRAEHYRLWFDRDEIHLGDPNWRARIDQGVERCDGLLLCLTPAACASEPVQYEVEKAVSLNKPVFPVVLERLADWGAALTEVGLTPDHHTEDFTDVAQWDAQVERLLRDLRQQGIRVTQHDRRGERDPDNPAYVLHQRYLRKVTERVGRLDLAQIAPEGERGVNLEAVYIDSPTPFTISVEVQDWKVVNWRVDFHGWKEVETATTRPSRISIFTDAAPFEALLNRIDERIAAYREENPNEKPDEGYSGRYNWKNGEKKDVIRLQLQHIAAAADRLVILGDPGSGKSTFVRHLALCLAGAGLSEWGRDANLSHLDAWTHGPLTPVYIELRRFVASAHFPAEMDTLPTVAHLWAYIQDAVLGADLRDYADDLRYDLEHGGAVLILDGLDEVPYPEGKLPQRRAQLVQLASSIQSSYPGSRVVVASRPYAYEGWKLPDFKSVRITAFKDGHRIQLAERLYRAAGQAADDARAKARALNEHLRPIDPELKDRPLFVTLMATIYLKGDREGLPTRRGALYRESILLLLDRWTTSKDGLPTLTELLGDKSLDDLYDRLTALAYDVHTTYGDQPGTPEIDVGLLFKHLMPLGYQVAGPVIPYLSENAGVLVSPGQDDQKDVFHFAHRTFQEYLAAAKLAGDCLHADDFTAVADHLTEKPQIWRVPGVLVGDVLADTDRRGDLWELLEDLLDDEALDHADGTYPGWWRVWLASEILLEQDMLARDRLRRSEKDIRDQLRERTVALIETPGALEPPERAACGRALGLLGDPRPGVGLTGEGLPDIDWVTIPAGEFIYQDGKMTLDYDFQISRYPVTYAQFQAFLDAPDGYDSKDPDWFDGLAADDDDRQMREQAFQYDNHPRENVNWYQAVAFCRWLSWRYEQAGLRAEIRLPTEQEWEKAARGRDGRVYPWGDKFDAGKANAGQTGVGRTSAVGAFPGGASPYGLLDASGNVWEMCLTQYYSGRNSVNGTEVRVLRGGSWYDANSGLFRCANRGRINPVTRVNNWGLRLALSY